MVLNWYIRQLIRPWKSYWRQTADSTMEVLLAICWQSLSSFWNNIIEDHCKFNGLLSTRNLFTQPPQGDQEGSAHTARACPPHPLDGILWTMTENSLTFRLDAVCVWKEGEGLTTWESEHQCVHKEGILLSRAATRTLWAFSHPRWQAGRAKDKGDVPQDHGLTRWEWKKSQLCRFSAATVHNFSPGSSDLDRSSSQRSEPAGICRPGTRWIQWSE